MRYLVQTDIPYKPTVFTPYRSGLWSINLYGVTSFTYDGVYGTYSGLAQLTPAVIGQLRIGTTYYSEVDSIETVFDNPGTFYYDSDNFQIVVNISENGIGYQVPYGCSLEVGIITGFIDRVPYDRTEQCYFNDIYHSPRISSIGDFSAKRDRLFFGVNSYTSVDIEIDNYDGKYDDVDFLGDVFRIYAIEDDADTYSADDVIQYGIATSVKRTNQKVVVTIGDRRKSLDDTDIDLGYINPTNYPYMFDTDEEDDGDYAQKPIAIGKIVKYKPTCIDKGNKTITTASYILTAVTENHTLYGVDNVWVQLTDANSQLYDLIIPAEGETISDPTALSDDSTYATVSTDCYYTVDYLTGLLTISVREDIVCETTADSSSSTGYSYSWTDLNVNFYGWYNSTSGESEDLCGVDLVRIGYEDFGGIDYRSWNFDITKFEIERVKSMAQGRAYSILIEDTTTIADYLKKVCDSADTITTCTCDGLFTVLVLDRSSGPIKFEFEYTDLFDRTDNEDQTLSEVISTVSVDYGYAGDDDNKKTLKDTSHEETIEEMYHTTRSEEYTDLCLADKASAQDKIDSLFDEAEDPTKATDVTLWAKPSLLRLNPVDTVTCVKNRDNDRAVYTIASIKKSRSNNKISFTLHHVSDVDYDEGYTQGYPYGIAVFGVNPLGVTSFSED